MGGTLTLVGDVSYRSKNYLEVNSSENLRRRLLSWLCGSSCWSCRRQHDGNAGGKNLTDEELSHARMTCRPSPGVELGLLQRAAHLRPLAHGIALENAGLGGLK